MTYAIARVMYGYPLTQGKLAKLVEDGEFEGIEDGGGYCQYYSGSSDVTPAAFGIELCSFDECAEAGFTSVPTLKLTPDTQQRNKFKKMLADQPPHIQKLLKDIIGAPFVFFLWTSS